MTRSAPPVFKEGITNIIFGFLILTYFYFFLELFLVFENSMGHGYGISIKPKILKGNRS
jgi:hypothetical protein